MSEDYTESDAERIRAEKEKEIRLFFKCRVPHADHDDVILAIQLGTSLPREVRLTKRVLEIRTRASGKEQMVSQVITEDYALMPTDFIGKELAYRIFALIKENGL